MTSGWPVFAGGAGFEGRVRAVVAGTGWRPSSVTPTAAVFRLAYRGREYEVVLEAAGAGLKLTACSNARFALRQVPPGLGRALAERDAALPHLAWTLYHGDRSSWPVAVTHVRDGTAEAVRAAAGVLVAEAAALDDGLRAAGVIE
jgi:hypothetical protein